MIMYKDTTLSNICSKREFIETMPEVLAIRQETRGRVFLLLIAGKEHDGSYC